MAQFIGHLLVAVEHPEIKEDGGVEEGFGGGVRGSRWPNFSRHSSKVRHSSGLLAMMLPSHRGNRRRQVVFYPWQTRAGAV